MANGISFSEIFTVNVREWRTENAVKSVKIIPHKIGEIPKLSSESVAELTCVRLPITKDAKIHMMQKIKEGNIELKAAVK